jgi:hypothetical protein
VIAYDVDIDAIQAAVDAIDPRWRSKAAQRTKTFVRAKKFEEVSSIWSVVKPAFIELQHGKCIFCERQLESSEYGRIEHDLEHFRPKSSVKPWPPASWPEHYDAPMGAESKRGYYWLAYDLLNYAASCKVCNSPLKSNHFPIAGARSKMRRSSDQLAGELPYLCYPIGGLDDDPETLVTFIGTTAIPAAKTGHKKLRGQVIIDFFQLNERLQLHRERARMISLLGSALKSLEAGIDLQTNTQVESGLLRVHIPHTACLRAYRRLWNSDKTLAKKIHSACQIYAIGMEEAKPPQF